MGLVLLAAALRSLSPSTDPARGHPGGDGASASAVRAPPIGVSELEDLKPILKPLAFEAEVSRRCWHRHQR